MYEKYINPFIDSEEMRSYLSLNEKWVSSIADIIFYSNKPIENKLIALRKLSSECLEKGNHDLKKDCNTFIRDIDMAKIICHEKGMFTVECCWMDGEDYRNNHDLEFIVEQASDVMDGIHQNMEENQYSIDTICWYKVLKWIKNANDKYYAAGCYLISRGKIIWYQIYEVEGLEDRWINSYDGVNLNLPVPFQAGDIIEVDGYPFSSRRQILVLSVGDNRDCCCVQCLYSKGKGIWNVGSLKHGDVGIQTSPQFSPLYSIHEYNKELTPEQSIFYDIKRWISGSEKKGKRFLNQVYSIDSDVSFEQLQHVLELCAKETI